MMLAMKSLQDAICLGSGPDPLSVANGWPAGRPLAALLSARPGSEFGRWSILSSPTRHHPLGAGALGNTSSLKASLDQLRPDATLPPEADPDCPPFRGGRLMVLAYELGGILEPHARHRKLDSLEGKPLGHVLECPTALVHDRDRNCWWQVGDPVRGEDFRPMLEVEPPPPLAPFPSRPLRPDPDDQAYARLIERTIEYVHAGDIFQANITRRFRSKIGLESVGMLRRFATALLADSGALFGAVLDLGEQAGDRTVISLSPELFLEIDPIDRSIRTRPVKGTLPGGSDPELLRRSGKDAAELAMIVDLMRNDLGRICELGSVRVTEPRSIESHPDVIHGVAEVRGRLKSTVGFAELLGATFPAGSITGAPKIRAMQVIDELESSPRGLYCGGIGYASNCGRTTLDVSIRTLDLKRIAHRESAHTHEIVYGAGCGTVADSTPWSEVAESHAKAALLATFLETHDCSGVTMEGSGDRS